MERIKIDFVVNENKDTLEQMLSFVYNQKEARELIEKNGLDKQKVMQNIGIFYDYASDREYCSACPGIEYCQKNNPCLNTRITIKKDKILSSITPCDKYFSQLELKSKFLYSDFPDNWLLSSLNDLDQSESRKKALLKYVKYIKGVSNEWIYILGAKNTGCSFLAASLCIDAAKKDIFPICFVNTVERFKEIASLYYKNYEDFKRGINILSNCQILVLDNFGDEDKNNLIRDKILYKILESRNINNLLTIFISRKSINKVSIEYATSKAGEAVAKNIRQLIQNKAKKEISIGEISIY